MRSTIGIACISVWLGAAPAQLGAQLLQASGKVTLLRVHDVGTRYGPPADQIDVEVVFWLDSQPGRAFGFQLRDDADRAAHQGMLDLLRDAFTQGWTVTTDYEIDDPQNKRNGVAIRVWLTGNTPPPAAYHYLAKFACGGPAGDVLPLGTYFTAVNVGNPSDEAVAFTKRFSIALPGEMPGPVSRAFDARLGAHQSFEIDCADIFTHTQSAERFLKGFVFIESGHQLEVVVVYAAARADDGQVVTEHVEPVVARVLELELPDLVPVPDAAGLFCRMVGNRLLVTIANRGSARATASTTEVDFLDGTKDTAATSELAAGASADLLFDPPANFRDEGTHNFLITADVLFNVAEESESNNTAAGQCIVIR